MSYLLIFHHNDLLLTASHSLPTDEARNLLPTPPGEWLTLPALDGMPCKAAEVAEKETVGVGEWIGLRESYYVLPSTHFMMAGKAHELLHWHSHSRYCGACGASMEWSSDISKRCPRCGHEIWAAVQPAMIVAVTRNEGREILLVQSKNFKRDYLGLVAGYVETGESLEDCVRREVLEETGLRIRNLRYFASQSWPFPNVLMMGFTAEYDGGELRLQRSELNKGGWFSRDNLPAIPGKVSLARRLIDHWLDQAALETLPGS